MKDEEGGFLKRRDCADQVSSLREKVNNIVEKEKIVSATYVDLEKVYYGVGRRI